MCSKLEPSKSHEILQINAPQKFSSGAHFYIAFQIGKEHSSRSTSTALISHLHSIIPVGDPAQEVKKVIRYTIFIFALH